MENSKSEMIEAKAQVIDAKVKSQLITVFKNILNILRDNESLTGEKALRNMSFLITMKMIEPLIEKEIMIDNYHFHSLSMLELNQFEGATVEEQEKARIEFPIKLKRVTRLSNFTELKEDDYSRYMGYLWDYIFSEHHILKKIFDPVHNKFDIKRSWTFLNIIKQLNSINVNDESELDVLGAAYEEVIQDIFIGKVLGQFFTPTPVKKIMIDLIKPVVFEDGKIESCCDPTMGTGGFLISYVKEIMRQAKEKNITLDWTYILKNVYGKEIEVDTYKLAVSNMLIATGHIFDCLQRGDSIREPILKQYDCVLANPPFGIKGLKYTEFHYANKHEYIPIKSDNAVSLFLQAIIFMLKVEGRCAIVLPDGQDLFSKTNKALVAVREYLMRSCDLQEIVYLPANTFSYTSIKTCVFYFVKKKEMKDTMELKLKCMNKHPFTETSRHYNFVKEHATTTVKFYEMDVDFKEKKLLVEVPIEALSINMYSLNYMEYMKTNETEPVYGSNIQVKTLGEVCLIKSGNHSIKKKDFVAGEYLIIGGGKTPIGYHNEYNCDENTIVCASHGTAGYISMYNVKTFLTMSFALIEKKDIVNKYYLFYYLKLNEQVLMSLAKGSAQPCISIERLKSIKIPIPSLEVQQEMVEYFDFIYEVQVKSSEKKIEGLKELNVRCIKNSQKLFGSSVVKILGEVCKFKNGKGLKRENIVLGEYPVIGGGTKPIGFHNQYNTNANVILCSASGTAGYISLYEKPVWASDCFSIIPDEKIIMNKFLFYYLKSYQDDIYKLKKGSAQPHVYSRDLKEFKIPIPTLEQQKEIVEYCEFNEILIQQLEKEISNNKIQVKKYLEAVVMSNVEQPEESVQESPRTEEEEESDAKRSRKE